MKEMEPDSFQGCHWTRANGYKLKYRNSCLKIGRNLFNLSTGMGYMERLWSLHPWRYSLFVPYTSPHKHTKFMRRQKKL